MGSISARGVNVQSCVGSDDTIFLESVLEAKILSHHLFSCDDACVKPSDAPVPRSKGTLALNGCPRPGSLMFEEQKASPRFILLKSMLNFRKRDTIRLSSLPPGKNLLSFAY